MTEEQTPSLPQYEFFDVGEERIKEGAREIEKVWGGLSFGERQRLLSDDWQQFSDEVSAVFLGIKPCAAVRLTPEISERIKALQKSGELSDDYVVTDKVFYSKQRVKYVVEKNRNMFSLSPEEEVNVEQVLSGYLNTSHDAEEKVVATTGVLLGYPPEAAISFAKYNKYKSQFFDYAFAHREEDVVFRNFTYSTTEDQLNANFWMDRNTDRIIETINEIDEFKGIPEDAKEYIAHVRAVHTRGFDFAVQSTSSYYRDFKNFSYNVNLVFHDAGVTRIYRSHLDQ